MTPPRRPVGRPPYNPRKACAAMRGVGDAAPYKVRRAVGAGHARPAASRNRPFTVDPQGRDSSLPRRVPLPPKQKPRKAPRPARSFCILRQHRTIPALRLKHRSGGCGTASALPKCSIMSGCGTRIVLRGQKPLALCDRCPCFGSLFPPLAALTFAASSIICAFGLAAAAPRSPYRHLELCGIA